MMIIRMISIIQRVVNFIKRFMANFATLLQTIASNIYTNGRNEIDAADLKSVLNAMVEELGQAGYIFKGVAQPSTNPGTPDTNVFYNTRSLNWKSML